MNMKYENILYSYIILPVIYVQGVREKLCLLTAKHSCQHIAAARDLNAMRVYAVTYASWPFSDKPIAAQR